MAIQISEIRSIKDRVSAILNAIPQANSSDDYLYMTVCKELASEKGIALENMTFFSVMKYGRELGFPTYETVRRARQKIHEKNPSLRKAADDRAESEKAFYSFAKE